MDDRWRVAWGRGRDCRPLAEALGAEVVGPLQGDWLQACVTNRVDVLVAKRMTSFDLLPVAVPHGVKLENVASIAAAIGAGPHSELAAAVATRLARSLGVPAVGVAVFRSSDEQRAAEQRLAGLQDSHPDLDMRAIGAPTAAGLTEALTASTLLVLGAPGGSWLQRQLFGPGHKLTVAAPGGAVVVRSAPRRSFHGAVDPLGWVVSPHLSVHEAQRLFDQPSLPVVEGGRLTGLVRSSALRAAPGELTVADVMEPPVAHSR